MLQFFKKNTEAIHYTNDIKNIKDLIENLKTKSQDELIQYIEEIKVTSKRENRRNMSFALASEVIYRIFNIRTFDVQLSGAIAIAEGNIAQMRTGEGKTITAILPALYGAIEGLKTYVISVNEYLVERDYQQAREIFNYLNMEIGHVSKEHDNETKKEAYKYPVIYITNSELAFDYLRDNIAGDKHMLMQGDYDFVIIDEADLVLIDEAKNPVIISGGAKNNSYYYKEANKFVKSLSEDDYTIDEENFMADLTEEGFDKVSKFLGYEVIESSQMYQAVTKGLLAHFKLEKDIDYIVKDGEVLIVDKFTGRTLSGRRFQDGLHQAIEVKENVEIKEENSTLATTTYQSLFQRFGILSGMTGTAVESEIEFISIYNTGVKQIIPNLPVLREDKEDILFENKENKYKYLIDLVFERHTKGQPVLIGTTSVRESEEVVALLEKENLLYSLLNAKNNADEANIIARAGEEGAITIATNMAGRGTDIKISDEVEKLGGLLVIGTSRNESKRIDRQLRGRSGRQGQKGESIFLTSLEDEIILYNPSYSIEKFVSKNEVYPIEGKKATELIDAIQNKLEANMTKSRTYQYKLDEILGYQRNYIYQIRKDILKNKLSDNDVRRLANVVIDELIEVEKNSESPYFEDWDIDNITKVLYDKFQLKYEFNKNGLHPYDTTKAELLCDIVEQIMALIAHSKKTSSNKSVDNVIRLIALSCIDKYWISYLDEVDLIKYGISIGSFGERDPYMSFTLSSDEIFKRLLFIGKEDIISMICKTLALESRVDAKNYYITFAKKDSHSFSFSIADAKGENVRAIVEDANSVILDTGLINIENDLYILKIDKRLDSGDYRVLVYVNNEVINESKFKVAETESLCIKETDEQIKIELPDEEMYKTGELLYVGVLGRPGENSMVMDIPVGHNSLIIGKTVDEKWEKGTMIFTLYSGDIPIYVLEINVD